MLHKLYKNLINEIITTDKNVFLIKNNKILMVV